MAVSVITTVGNFTIGTGNVALGTGTLDDASFTGSYNTAVGSGALTFNTSGSNNFAFGANTLYSNTTGSNNAAISGLYSNTTGGNNTALGMQSLNSNTTASNNTAVGYQAMYLNTTGVVNAAFGRETLASNTSGSFNTAFGTNALFGNTTANSNTALGYQAGYSSTGGANTFVGETAGYSVTTASNNTFIGREAGFHVTTGANNTILGKYTGNQGGLDIRTSSNNIVLSDGDGNPRARWASANLWVGGFSMPNGGVTGQNNFISSGAATFASYQPSTGGSTHIYFNNPNGTVGQIYTVNSSTVFATSSDYRLKENVVDLTGATDRLKQLEPKRFNFIADTDDTTVDGFLAHEVQTVVPEAIIGTHNEVDDDGNPVYQGIDQSKLVPLLVATIKELEARITALENA